MTWCFISGVLVGIIATPFALMGLLAIGNYVLPPMDQSAHTQDGVNHGPRIFRGF